MEDPSVPEPLVEKLATFAKKAGVTEEGGRLIKSAPGGSEAPTYPIDISREGRHVRQVPSRASLFKSNRSQAVRLPKELAFPEGVKQVAIRKVGKARIIMPADAAWDDFFEAPGIDLGERRQPEAEAREGF